MDCTALPLAVYQGMNGVIPWNGLEHGQGCCPELVSVFQGEVNDYKGKVNNFYKLISFINNVTLFRNSYFM